MSGEPAAGRRVDVGPPLSASDPSSGSMPCSSPAWVKTQLVSDTMLWPLETIGPPQFDPGFASVDPPTVICVSRPSAYTEPQTGVVLPAIVDRVTWIEP